MRERFTTSNGSTLKNFHKLNQRLVPGGGEMGHQVRNHNWAATSLGPIQTWPIHLRTTVSTLLNSGIGMFLWWGKDMLQFYNDAYLPAFGKKSGAFPGAPGVPGAESWGESWSHIYPHIQRVMQTGEAGFGKNQLIPHSRNGYSNEAYSAHSYNPVFNGNGEVDGVLAVEVETTKEVEYSPGTGCHASQEENRRKELEQLNARTDVAHEKLRALFMQAPVAIAIYRGPKFIVDFANPAVCEFWGRPYKEVIHKPLFEALPEAAEQGFEELLNSVLETGKPVELSEVSVLLNRNGVLEKVFFNLTLHALYEQDKEMQDIVVIANEITDQVVARQKIEESEEKYRTLFNSIDEGFAIIELVLDENNKAVNYKFVEVNPAFERHTGLKNVTGRYMKDIVPQHEDSWYETYEQVLLTGVPTRLERYSSGLKHYFDVYAFRIGDPQRKRVAVIFSDITDRKLLEMRKDDFISIASHELKTPVTSIKAYAQLLELHFENERDLGATSLIQKMNKQVNKMTILINDLLDTSKLDSNNLQFHRSDFDLNNFIEEVSTEFQPTVSTHRIVVHTEGVIMVNADRDRILQVLTNYLTNAVKYSPVDTEIHISTKVEKQKVTVSVRDHGDGIAAGHLTKIFDRFYRVTEDTAHSSNGLGLGLYICKEIINHHGGEVWVENADGGGAVFNFSLPL